MMIPEFAAGDVPYLTTGQMIEVDRAMMEGRCSCRTTRMRG
jgi:hypothetical protein